MAEYTAPNKKIYLVEQASVKLDALKFFLQIAWELQSLDNKKYITLSEQLAEIGRMLGGWRKQLYSKTPPA